MVKNPPANAGDIGVEDSVPGSADPLEEEMAAHSNILAWRIPWTEEFSGLQSTGSQRVKQPLRGLSRHCLSVNSYVSASVVT